MNPPKVTDEDNINFIIATPRFVTATEPDAQTLWEEAKTQIEVASGILALDDSRLEKPYSQFNALVYRHWSGKQKKSFRAST